MAEPIAVDDIYSATAGESKILGLVFNFFGNTFDLSGLLKNDSDDDGDSLSIASAEGQVLNDGKVTVIGDNGGAFTIYADGGF